MSKIEWTGETWNPLIGCSKVSAGCKNCYAIQTAWIRLHNPKMSERYAGVVEKTPAGNLNWTGKVNQVDSVLDKPHKNKKPTMYFVNSMSDLFHEAIPFEFIYSVFMIMQKAHWHTFQVLTKRPERMYEFYHGYSEIKDAIPNVWMGVSVEDQKNADERIPLLMQIPAAVRFLSCEPLLGEIDLKKAYGIPHPAPHVHAQHVFPISHERLISWVICGGESGPGARPMHPDWARKLRNDCKDYGIPFFFKQWGSWYVPTDSQNFDTSKGHAGKPVAMIVSYDGTVHCFKDTAGDGYQVMIKGPKIMAGRVLDGQLHDEFPNP